MRPKLGAGLVREPRHVLKFDPGQDQILVTPESLDVRGLPLEIDVVLGIDLEMEGDLGIDGRELRPDR